MSEFQKLVLKDDGEEYDLYIATKDVSDGYRGLDEDEPGYRDIDLPTVDLEKVHKTIRGYAKYAIGAFKGLGSAEVEKVTLKFGLKIGGKAGIPMLTEGSGEGNFDIEIECKFPTKSSSSTDKTN